MNCRDNLFQLEIAGSSPRHLLLAESKRGSVPGLTYSMTNNLVLPQYGHFCISIILLSPQPGAGSVPISLQTLSEPVSLNYRNCHQRSFPRTFSLRCPPAHSNIDHNALGRLIHRCATSFCTCRKLDAFSLPVSFFSISNQTFCVLVLKFYFSFSPWGGLSVPSETPYRNLIWRIIGTVCVMLLGNPFAVHVVPNSIR